jgi:hypothetical protein
VWVAVCSSRPDDRISVSYSQAKGLPKQLGQPLLIEQGVMKMSSDAVKGFVWDKHCGFVLHNPTKQMVRVGRVRIEPETSQKVVPNQDAPYDAIAMSHRNGIVLVALVGVDGVGIELDYMGPPAESEVQAVEIKREEASIAAPVPKDEVVEQPEESDEPPFGEPAQEAVVSAPKYSREVLSGLSYSELQAVARDAGINARAKRDELIEALLGL